jgi:glycosyltransferase involved in cell wall biosynthesis
MTAMVLGRGDGEAAGRFAARHPDVAARLGADEERRLRHLASPNFLVQAVRGPLPAPVYIYARLPNSAFGANRAMADVRVARPLQFFGAIPNVHIWVSRDPEPMRPPVRPDGIFLYQRPILRRPHAIDLLRQIVQRRYVVVLEFDDHPNHWADIAAHDHLTFAGVHAVQTSTEPLAEVLRQHNPNVEVFRNHVAELPPRAERPPPTDERPLRIFYGSLNRVDSMRPLIEAVNRVLASAPVPVHVSVVADRNFHDQLRTARKDFAEMVSHERHRQMVSEADIVLLPLADTTFNRCKSDLSFVEAAARGAVVLASPIVYAGTVEDGRTGMIFRSPAEFEAKLDRLVRDPALRSEIAGNAYDYVRRNRLQKDAFRRRWRWYRSLLDRKEELDRGLRERVPEFRDL